MLKHRIISIFLILAVATIGYFVWQSQVPGGRFQKYAFKLGLDLNGGTELVYKADVSRATDITGAMSSLRDVIERRINLFGVAEPVITVQKFSDEAQAVSMANGVEYGLASSVWTANHGTAMRMAKAFDFGCVWINTHIPLVAEMPHGGFKRSGYGKDLSGYGFEDYTRIKHVMTNLGA